MADYAARVRAARGFADMTQQELADALGVEVQTIKRREKPPSQRGSQEPKKGERLAIAQICGVPPAFMEDGFRGQARSEMAEMLTETVDTVRELLVRERERSQRTDEDDPQSGASLPPPPP